MLVYASHSWVCVIMTSPLNVQNFLWWRYLREDFCVFTWRSLTYCKYYLFLQLSSYRAQRKVIFSEACDILFTREDTHSTPAVGTRPTGMHSCWKYFVLFRRYIILNHAILTEIRFLFHVVTALFSDKILIRVVCIWNLMKEICVHWSLCTT